VFVASNTATSPPSSIDGGLCEVVSDVVSEWQRGRERIPSHFNKFLSTVIANSSRFDLASTFSALKNSLVCFSSALDTCKRLNWPTLNSFAWRPVQDK